MSIEIHLEFGVRSQRMQATALLEFGEFHIAGHAGKKKQKAEQLAHFVQRIVTEVRRLLWNTLSIEIHLEFVNHFAFRGWTSHGWGRSAFSAEEMALLWLKALSATLSPQPAVEDGNGEGGRRRLESPELFSSFPFAFSLAQWLKLLITSCE